MFKHILVAVDFSSAWHRLRKRLEELAAWGATHITVVHVLSSRYPATAEETHRAHYEASLADLAGELATPGLQVDAQVRAGEPGAVLAAAAQELGADLLLLGCRGHSRWYEFFLGSTALDAARLAPCPVWLESIDEGQPSRGSQLMMLATDGSRSVAGAESLARDLAPRFQRSLAVIATCASESCEREVNDAQRHMETLTGRINGLETKVLDGDPRYAIVAEANKENADLIVIGKRGRNPIQEFLLGSTAESIARGARCSVLVVPGKAD